MRIKPRIEFAKRTEPYWWLDSNGFRHLQFVCLYRAHKIGDDSVSIWGLIVGPLQFRIGIAT